MSQERLHEPGEKLFPVSKKALEQAFPYSTNADSVQRAILRETVEMHEKHPQLLDHLKNLRETYQASNLDMTSFVDGGKFMYRILRNYTSLPPISPNVLFTYDMEQKREIADRQKGIKEYFVSQWMVDFQKKQENKELAKTIEKAGEKRTNRREEIYGGAYYVAKAFERQINVNKANEIFSDETRAMKKIFPNFFT